MTYANATAAREKGTREGKVESIPLPAAGKIFKGSIVLIDANGYATVTAAANLPYAGVALETVDNTGGANGAKRVQVALDGVFSFIGANFTQAHQADVMYLDTGANKTPHHVTASAPANFDVEVGRVSEVVSATEVMVRIDGYAYKTQCDAT